MKNQDHCVLVAPNVGMVDSISKFRRELIETNSPFDGTNHLIDYNDVKDWINVALDWSRGLNLPVGYSPMTQLVFLRSSDSKIVGMLSIKHTLNDYLLKYAGNIAYSICPSERNKGYGTDLLHKALPICRKLGLKKILVTCYSYNAGSRKIILANGGIFDSTVFDEKKGLMLERYWITL